MSSLAGVRLVLVLVFSLQVFAEKLPLKIYSSADGLASDTVNQIYPDSKGFLWFCTDDGLSRFDGYRFKNYTQEEGLPHRNINDFLETADGAYLIATPNGLAVFNPLGKHYRWNIIDGRLEQDSSEPPLFKTYVPLDSSNPDLAKRILYLTQDGNGKIYVSTRAGFYNFVKTDSDWEFREVKNLSWQNEKHGLSGVLFTDSRGDVWLGTGDFIYRILKSGEIEKISEPGGNGFFEDRDGNIWVNSGGHDFGIRVFSIENNKPVLKRLYTRKDGLTTNMFSNAIVQEADGRIIVNSNGGLFDFIPGAKENELKFRSLDRNYIVTAVNKDGTIWFGTNGKGVARYSPNSFYTFDEKDGLPNEWIKNIFGNKNGDIFLSVGYRWLIRIRDGKLEKLKISGSNGRGWIDGFFDLQSVDDEFWVSTVNGLLRFPPGIDFDDLTRIRPKKVYTTVDGLLNNDVIGIFEDSRGDIWISASYQNNSPVRWEKATGKIRVYSSSEGLPDGARAGGVISFGEDAAGNLWFGCYGGQIIRYKDGKFRDFTGEGLMQPNFVTEFLSDDQGRLWLSTTNRGLFRVDQPNADRPVFTNFSMTNGLSSNQTNCLTKDTFGRIYVATGRGINRLEPETGRVKIFTQNDGLPGNMISHCYTDVSGTLWFSSTNSLIKFIPEAEKPSVPPPIFIDRISVNGKLRPISELGEKEIGNLEFGSDERQFQIGFFAISFEPGDILRYQYKIGEQPWSEASERRTVDFNLSPGTYEFSVRAITANGVLSQNSATITFTIARPFWQRWWFIGSMVLILGAAVFALDRYRVRKTRQVENAYEELRRSEAERREAEAALQKSREERLAELERVRTRIATDLHDDIGSSLTQIAVLSEVARGQAGYLGAENLSTPLERIKGVSRELVSVMSDIVWAINPAKDNLPDLVQRMRRFGSDVLSGRGIRFEFETPAVDGDLALGANVRREVFAIYKEAVNNVVKYAECTETKVVFHIESDWITLRVEDNGKGFETKDVLSEDFRPEMGGNGLVNMRRRARDLGGSCRIVSDIGQGTKITLKIPLHQPEHN